MKPRWRQAVLGILLIAGMVFTVWDYRDWKWEETRKYGHGYEDQLAPAVALTRTYQNDLVRVRLKYPEEWEINEISNSALTFEEMVKEGGRVVVAQWPGKMTLSIEKTTRGLPDIADEEVRLLNKAGVNLSKEREYISTQETNMTVLTWEKPNAVRQQEVIQRGLAEKKGRLAVAEAKVSQADWLKWGKTFWEIYRSIIIF
ncbi:hypothetical protein A2379_00030 [Candidatus Amesbacteria bacterium RIFOXYB1_FULL_47_13]|nr:MAG: hypothetical protein A2379_00030 [Candidatus Amesbacteria bacterium RIFOXYB1_FULL_47_13]HBC73123.1 hypothetical protein [Candidatus Amesbacteria bacterium]